MRNRAFLIACLALAGAVGCHETDETLPNEPIPRGAMSYTAFDQSGHAVVTGWIRLGLPTEPTATEITGEWDLRALVDPSLTCLGAQHDHGALIGSLDGTQLTVQLYPGAVDFGCYLSGTLTPGTAS